MALENLNLVCQNARANGLPKESERQGKSRAYIREVGNSVQTQRQFKNGLSMLKYVNITFTNPCNDQYQTFTDGSLQSHLILPAAAPSAESSFNSPCAAAPVAQLCSLLENRNRSGTGVSWPRIHQQPPSYLEDCC